MTKTDLVKADDLARRHYLLSQELKKYKYALPEIFMLSSYTGAGISRLRGHLGGLAMTDLQIRQMVKNKQEKEAKMQKIEQQQQSTTPEEEKSENAEEKQVNMKPKKQKKKVKQSKYQEKETSS